MGPVAGGTMTIARPDWTREKGKSMIAGRRGPPDRYCDLKLRGIASA